MFKALSQDEKELMFLIIQGHNFNGITEWLSIDYSEYLTIKRSLLKKLHVKRITQILSVALLNGLNIDEL